MVELIRAKGVVRRGFRRKGGCGTMTWINVETSTIRVSFTELKHAHTTCHDSSNRGPLTVGAAQIRGIWPGPDLNSQHLARRRLVKSRDPASDVVLSVAAHMTPAVICNLAHVTARKKTEAPNQWLSNNAQARCRCCFCAARRAALSPNKVTNR